MWKFWENFLVMTIGKIRSILYKTAKILGDINAVKRGKIGQRTTNRLIGKTSSRINSKISKSILKFFK